MSLSQPIVIVGILICLGIALAGLFRPILGLLVFLVMHFSQPAEVIPALAGLRTEFVYGILLFGALAFRRASVRSPRLFFNRILLAAMLLLCIAGLSVPFSVWRGGALDGTIYLAKLVALLFFLSSLIETSDHLRKVLWLLVGLLGWFASSGLVAYSHGEFYALGSLERAKGVGSLVGGPNELAGLLLALLPFLIALFRCSRSVLIRILLIGCGGLAVATLVLTGSRIAMLGFVTLGVYYIAKSTHKILYVALYLAFGCVVWFSMPATYQQRYLTVKTYAAGGKLDPSNEYRLQVWNAGWRMFLDHPVLGVGAGQFPTAFGLVYSDKEHGPWMNPHNLLIQVACELGLVGLAVFAYFLVQIKRAIRSVLRLKSNLRAELNYQVAIACNAMFLATIVMSTVGHSLYRPYWYLLAGLAAANRSLIPAPEQAMNPIGLDEEAEAAAPTLVRTNRVTP